MKLQISILLLTIASIVGCNAQTDGYTIDGLIEGAGDGQAILSMRDDAGTTIISDTVVLKGGKFTFTGTTPYVDFASIRIAPAGFEPTDIRLILENVRMKVSGHWSDMYERDGETVKFTVEGSPNNEVHQQLGRVWREMLEHPDLPGLKEMFDKMLTIDFEDPEQSAEWYAMDPVFRPLFNKYNELKKAEELRIVRANPSVESAGYWLTFMKNDLSLEELEEIVGGFTPNVQQSRMTADVRENIEIRGNIEPGRPAPDFTLAQRDGATVTLSDLRGSIVVVDFWASWCGPCRMSFPWVREFYAEYNPKGVGIIGVSIDEKRSSWERALDEEKLPWAQVLDTPSEGLKSNNTAGRYNILAIPTLVLVGRDGRIVAHGHFDREELTKMVDELLAK